MTESWRRKRYYSPRVLIPIDDIQDPPLADCLVCLEGHELLIIRNLLQYAHYRSTWVSEYYDAYYLAPDNDEWDYIEGVTAALEAKLMDCETFSSQLEELLRLAQQQATEPYIGEYIGDLVDDGTLDWTFPDDTQTTIDTEACSVAQLVYALAYEYLVETLQPLQELLLAVLLPAVLGLLATAIGGPILGLSAAAFTALAQSALEMGAESDLENVENELMTLKTDLVCALYAELSTGGTYAAAAAAAAAVIDGSTEWSPIDKVFMRRSFSPMFIEQAQAAYDAETAWATGNVQAGYCEACSSETFESDITFEFPPDTDWILGDGCLYRVPEGHLQIPGSAADRECYSPTYYGIAAGTYDIDTTVTGRGQDYNLRVYVDVSDDATNWDQVYGHDYDTPDTSGILCFGPYTHGTTMNVPEGHNFIRYRVRNRVTDYAVVVCSLRYVIEET